MAQRVTRLFKTICNIIPQMDAPKACLFDLDGVLIDSEPLHGKAWKQTASVFNLELSSERLKLLQGRRRVDCGKKIQSWMKNPPQLKELLEVHKPISRKLIIHAKAIPGSQSLVLWCKENQLPIALVTSSSSESVGIKCSPHPWLDIFSEKVLGDDPNLLKGKPHPDPYLLAAQRLKIDPIECWAIEDSISGATSALEAGCKVWFLNNSEFNPLINSITFPSTNLIKINNLNIILEKLKNIFIQ